MSGRSHDTRTQAVKSLPARPHSVDRRVREEPQHTFTGGQIPAGQTALGRSPCQGGAATHVHRWSSLLARLHSAGHRAREEPRHTYTGGHPCRPDCTQLVTVPGRSRNTDTQAVIPAGQTALSWSPCQGGAATQIHRRSSLLARPHSAGHRAREEPQHRYTCGQPCWPDHTH